MILRCFCLKFDDQTSRKFENHIDFLNIILTQNFMQKYDVKIRIIRVIRKIAKK